MKYKVSLLPEKNRKRIIGKKKAEKGKSVVNVFMLVLLGIMLITVICKVIADSKLTEIQAQNAQYEQKVSDLQKYRDINNSLQSKLKLIENVQVDEPSLYNFLAKIGNMKHPGISIENIEMLDWKTTRTCNITGSAISREAFNMYLEKLEKTDGVKSAVCTTYTMESSGNSTTASFAIAITCEGGAAPVTTAAQSTETTAADDELAVE